MKQKISEKELETFLQDGHLNVLGHELSLEEVSVSYASGGNNAGIEGFETFSDSKVTFVSFLFILTFSVLDYRHAGCD